MTNTIYNMCFRALKTRNRDLVLPFTQTKLKDNPYSEGGLHPFHACFYILLHIYATLHNT